MNWISVNERMPDDDTIVMVHAPGENEPVWLGYHSGEDGWRLVEGFDTKVTHWINADCYCKAPGHTCGKRIERQMTDLDRYANRKDFS